MTAQFPALGFKFERAYYYLRVMNTNSTIKYTIQSRENSIDYTNKNYTIRYLIFYNFK